MKTQQSQSPVKKKTAERGAMVDADTAPQKNKQFGDEAVTGKPAAAFFIQKLPGTA